MNKIITILLVVLLSLLPISIIKHNKVEGTKGTITTVEPKPITPVVVPLPIPKPKPTTVIDKDKDTCKKYLTYTNKYGQDIVDSNLKLRGFTDNQILKLRKCK